jgi:sugar phosphate isomerase/epimerase
MQKAMPQLTRPRYAVNAYSTPHNSVFDDIEQIARTGGEGVGLWEAKLPAGRDDEVREALAAHDLTATFCVPSVHTILPVPFNASGTPTDPSARTELACASVARLAAFDPVAIVIGHGTSGDPKHPVGPVEAVADGLSRVADAAAAHGQAIAFELLAERRGSPLHTLPDIVAFVDAVGRDNVGIMFDVFHSWCEPDLHAHLREHAHRVNSVHVNDVKVDERSGFDRELPGWGRDVAAGIIATLLEAGYDGWWELEVFSDDGTFGTELSDSYWKWPHERLLEEAKRAFDATYARALQMLAERAEA